LIGADCPEPDVPNFRLRARSGHRLVPLAGTPNFAQRVVSVQSSPVHGQFSPALTVVITVSTGVGRGRLFGVIFDMVDRLERAGGPLGLRGRCGAWTDNIGGYRWDWRRFTLRKCFT
jgi:hypothetical protein